MIRVTAFILLCLLVQSGYADDHDEAQRLLQQGKVQPLEKLLDNVLTKVPGKVLEVELEEEDGHYIYELEVLRPDNSVVEVKVNAASGELISTEKEH